MSRTPSLVWILWGKPAQNTHAKVLNAFGAERDGDTVIASHPSPLAAYRGFGTVSRSVDATRHWKRVARSPSCGEGQSAQTLMLRSSLPVARCAPSGPPRAMALTDRVCGSLSLSKASKESRLHAFTSLSRPQVQRVCPLDESSVDGALMHVQRQQGFRVSLHMQLSILPATQHHIFGIQMKGPVAAPGMRLHPRLKLAVLAQHAPLAASSGDQRPSGWGERCRILPRLVRHCCSSRSV